MRGGLERIACHRQDVRDCDLVLHLAGTTHESMISSYYRVNHHGTQKLLQACRPDQPVVYMSTRCIGKEGGAYSHSKQLAEQVIHASNCPYAIIRPSEVYGTESGEGIDALLRIASKTRLLADFRWDPPVTYSPISVRELANFTAKLVRNFRSGQDIYTICNSETYTAADIQHALTDRLRERIFRVPVPVKGLMLLKKVRFPLPFESDQLSRLVMAKSADNCCARDHYGFAPVPFTEAIRTGLVTL